MDNRTTPSKRTITHFRCSTSTTEATATSVVFGKPCPNCGQCKNFANTVVKACRDGALAVAFAPVAWADRSCACMAIGGRVSRLGGNDLLAVYRSVRSCVGENARVWAENAQRLDDCYFLDVRSAEPDIFVKASICEFVFPVLCSFD